MWYNGWVTVGMDLSCLLLTMRSRRAVPFLIPTIALNSRQLLFYDPRPLRTHLESTLLQVFILENLKPFGINTYEKQGRGYCLWLTDCSKVVSLLSVWERLSVDSRHQLQRIFVVDLLQHLVRHLETVNPPERVALAVILKILVARLERPEIPFVFVHLVDVFPHQHAVLILHQELMRRIGLPPQFRQHRSDVHVHVRQRVQSLAQPLQVVSMKPQVRGYEICSRMLCKQMVALRHQRLKRRILRRRPRPPWKFLQLLPALIVVVPRIDKRRRLPDVNQHGNLELRALLKHGIKYRIVYVDAFAIRIFQVHPEILENLQSLRAILDVLFQPRRHALPEPRRVQIVVTHICEHHKPARISPLHYGHGILQLFPRSSAEIHHDAQVDRVHLFHELIYFSRRGIPMMAVNIDERKFGSLDLVFLGNECGLWLVFVNCRRLLLLWSRALLGQRGSRPNNECGKYGNENYARK